METTTSKNPNGKSSGDPADLILVNGRIATQDGRGSFASALAIRGDRFAAGGDERSVAALRGPGTRVIDAGGRTAIPGLNDSPLHAIRRGPHYPPPLLSGGRPSLPPSPPMLRRPAG